jgi:hypothetical protein
MSDSDRIKDLYDELLTLVEKCPEDLVIFNFEKGTVRGVNYDNIHNLINYPNEFFKGMDRLNYISGFPTDRTISGDFNGDGKTDSLMLGPPFEKVFEAIRLLIYSETDRSEIEKFYEESIGGVENVSRVEFVFSDKTIPMLNMSSYWGYLIKNEGDLDGDGGDEIGFIAGWPTSDCRSYEVLTLKNNKWYSLGISSSCDMRIAGIAPIEKDPEQKGVILFRQPMSTSCLRCLFVIEWSRKAKDLKKWLYEQVITSGD